MVRSLTADRALSDTELFGVNAMSWIFQVSMDGSLIHSHFQTGDKLILLSTMTSAFWSFVSLICWGFEGAQPIQVESSSCCFLGS